MTFTHLDLFAGVGGFSRAVHWLGGTTVGFVEWDSWNRRVLAKHWPEAQFHGDIGTLTADTLRSWGIRTHDSRCVANAASVGDRERTDDGIALASERNTRMERGGGNRGCGQREADTQLDLLTGGYPCQPFSHAGKRLGAEDDRHLWPEMRRVLNLTRPRYVLAENVAGHVTMGLDTVLAELEADGYACGAIVVPACAVNALHRRDRVWIMAHAEGDLRRTSGDGRRIAPDGSTLDPSGMADADPQRPHTEQESGREGSGEADRQDAGVGALASHPSVGSDRQVGPEASRPVDAGADGVSAGLVRRPAVRSPWDNPDMIRAMWADGSWEADLPRVVAEEAERRQKLQAAGNAIVPIVAYEILRVMLGSEADCA